MIWCRKLRREKKKEKKKTLEKTEILQYLNWHAGFCIFLSLTKKKKDEKIPSPFVPYSLFLPFSPTLFQKLVLFFNPFLLYMTTGGTAQDKY